MAGHPSKHSRCAIWLAPAGCKLADARFAIVAEVQERRLQANYFCCTSALLGEVLFYVSSARFCCRGGRAQPILTLCREILEVLLHARDAALARFYPFTKRPDIGCACTGACATAFDPNRNKAAPRAKKFFNTLFSTYQRCSAERHGRHE
jgi:hypothetical protein